MTNQYHFDAQNAFQSLTDSTKFIIKQTAATMEIENMPLSQQCVQNMIDLSNGSKTSEEIVCEIYERYRAI